MRNRLTPIPAPLAVVLAVLAALPARAVDPKQVKRAIDHGTAALRALQTPEGTWVQGGPHDCGMTALAALTLVECGAREDDPAVRRAAAAVRAAVPYLGDTYSISLAILFLDRLADPADVPLIQVLAIRLLHGQRSGGGWSYDCPAMVGGEAEAALVTRPAVEGVLRTVPRKPGAGGPAGDLPEAIRGLLNVYAAQAPHAPQAGRRGRLTAQRGGPGEDFEPAAFVDHSNTQFATLGLWVARRHGIPVHDALEELDRHYRQCQNRDGGWGYRPGERSTATMTAAGILGLAVGQGIALDPDKRAGKTARPAAAKGPHLQHGLAALGTLMNLPLAPGGPPPDALGLPGPVGPPGRRGPRGRPFAGAMPPQGGTIYYFLWSVERLAVALGLRTVGQHDWYEWGARTLLTSQAKDGQWRAQFARGGADTCFALLFLARSNLAKDLTATLRGRAPDLGQAALHARVTNHEDAPGRKPSQPAAEPGHPPAPKRPAADRPKPPPLPDLAPSRPAAGSPKPRTQPAAQPAPAAKAEPPGRAAAEKPAAPTPAAVPPDPTRLAAEIAAAPADRLDEVLRRHRDATGVVHTEALAAAIRQLPHDAQKQARDALAERLSRMRVASLVNYLKDDDAEIRRAAALALSMKDSKDHIPDLIRMLDDPAEPVALGARAALKELTHHDFGPALGATPEARSHAVAAWRAWWEKAAPLR